MRRDKSAKSRQKWRAIIIAGNGRRPPGSEIVFGIIGIGIDVEIIDGVYVFETSGRRTPTQPQRDRGAGAGN